MNRKHHRLYDIAQALGTFLIDGVLFLFHWVSHFFRLVGRLIKQLFAAAAKPLKRVKTFGQTLLFEFTDPFSKAAENTFQLYDDLRHTKKGDRREALRTQTRPLLKVYGAALASLCNHLLPIVAVVAFAFVLGRTFSQNYLLQITYDNEVLGYVEDEYTYQEAKDMVTELAVFDQTAATVTTQTTATGLGTADTTVLPLADDSENSSYSRVSDALAAGTKTTFRLVPVQRISKDDSESLCDKLISALGDQIEEATGLYVDGALYGAVKDGAALNTQLQEILSAKDDGTGTVSFYRDVELREGLYPTNVILTQEKMNSLLTGKVAGKKEYIIEKGDAPYSIASKFDLSYKDFVAMNPGIETTCLVGQHVTIAQEEAFLPVLVTRQITYKRTVSYTTKTVESSSYSTSYAAVTTAGKAGEDTVTAKVSYLDGVEVDRQILKTVRTKEPVQQVVVRGTMVYGNSGYTSSGSTVNSSATNKNGFIWPTSGYVSCGWYGYAGHRGIDIATSTGNPVWAAASGTVVYAGWSTGGYGYYVQIDHGNGYQTLYAHNSALLVRAGQHVSQGQQIARIGMTGYATGPHCHFEVRINGVRYNPANYLP